MPFSSQSAVVTLACSPVAEAWAVASMAPANIGSRGFCASAWVITYDGWLTEEALDVKVSRAPNRDEWLAGIIAIRGVLEIVKAGVSLTIYTPNKALAGCYSSGWRTRRGRPHAEADAAAPIFQLRDELRIDLEVIHRPIDFRAERLKKMAREAAQIKDRNLTPCERRKVI